MSYRVLCDGYVLHDSNLDKFQLISPVLTLEVNKAGEFSFQIAHNHPYYDKLIKMKSVIDIYDDGVWLWSGRIINIITSMKLTMTVKCEGELAYLHDSNQRLAEYHNTSLSDYFTAVINNHNTDVDESKQFTVGTITVTDPNDELYRYSNYEDTFDTLKGKLVDRLGGYLVIRHENSIRYLDYVEEYPYIASQIIQLGSNIIDLSLNDSCSNMISGIIPLGYKLNETSQASGNNESERRLTIESVNDGLDYIINDDAVSRFGKILDVVKFDDVTDATNLMQKGADELFKRLYSKLKISLSIFDKGFVEENIDKFRLGAIVIADSPKHGLNQRQMTIDKISLSLVDVTKTKIEIGLTTSSLTNNVVQSSNNFDVKVTNIVKNYIVNEEMTVITPQIDELSSRIDQTASDIRTEVSQTYLATSERDAIYQYIQSLVTQTKDDITMTFTNRITEVENTVTVNSQNFERYIRFSGNDIELGDVQGSLGEGESYFRTNITNTDIRFSQNGNVIAYISNAKLYITNAEITSSLIIGNLGWFPRANGSTDLRKR